MKSAAVLLLLLALVLGCSEGADDVACAGTECECTGEACDRSAGKADFGGDYNALNLRAGTMVLYEVQVRTANACRPDVGASWQRAACEVKVAPKVEYRAEGMSCGEIDDLQAVKLGTLDDMMEPTDDFRAGITLRYIRERVGANTLWLMPIFPNNDTWNIPDPCDNLGSPYAVRDYLHVRGTLARECIEQDRDERSADPCWGNDTFDALMGDAHARGMSVMLDLALNHFGHNYMLYDYVDFDPVREKIARGEDPGSWDFAATYDERMLFPEVLDTPEELAALTADDPTASGALDALLARCPGLSGLDLVRAFNIWRLALDNERKQFSCGTLYLEYGAPGFYAGKNPRSPSKGAGDNFTNDWRDVKFLFHHGPWPGMSHEYYRNREYAFRIMNYWVSRGVDAFRLDHTTDGDSGLSPDDWDYIISKVDYYAWRRGQAIPVFLAEEFHDQGGMSKVVDVMTEGYVRDMTGRGGVTKDTRHVESVLDNMNRFAGQTYVMTALETHDEHRLVDGTGFDAWIGAGFWGIGATTWSTPMLLMGQELGEPFGLAFRKSDFLRSRFDGTVQQHPEADAIRHFYHRMITARLGQENRALYASSHAYLRAKHGDPVDPRLFAQVKWSNDGNVVFTMHNLWRQRVARSYYIDAALGDALGIRDGNRYSLVDAFNGKAFGSCRYGSELKWDLYVSMEATTRLQWMRLEMCP